MLYFTARKSHKRTRIINEKLSFFRHEETVYTELTQEGGKIAGYKIDLRADFTRRQTSPHLAAFT